MSNITIERINEVKGNLSQEEFAKTINSSQPVISKVLNGEPPSHNVLVDIATKYNVSVDWLLGLSPHKALNGHSKFDGSELITYADAISMIIYLLQRNSISYQGEEEANASVDHYASEDTLPRKMIRINDHFLGDLLVTADTILKTIPESITSWQENILQDYPFQIRKWSVLEEMAYTSGKGINTSLETLRSLVISENNQ